MKHGRIILLNGTSSSGKSSLAKAIQAEADQPYLHIDGDYFWQMFPDPYFDDKPDEIYRPWRGRFLPACYQSIAAFTKNNVNVIIDEVLTKPMTLTWLQQALNQFEVVFVGLNCGLEELKRRELTRGDRKVGLARFQYPNIHIHGRYDIEVNTQHNTPQACARQILAEMKNGRPFTRFQEAVERPLPN